jgi:sugar-specific transcriptional regulator TrmB
MKTREEALQAVKKLEGEVTSFKATTEKKIQELQDLLGAKESEYNSLQEQFRDVSRENEILHKRLGSFSKLEEALRTIKLEGLSESQIRSIVDEEITKKIATGTGRKSGIPDMVISSEALEVELKDKGRRVVERDTDSLPGKILYIIKEDFEGKGATQVEIRKKAQEYGWVRGFDAGKVSKTVYALKDDGLLVVEEDGSLRLPTKVEFNIKKTQAWQQKVEIKN